MNPKIAFLTSEMMLPHLPKKVRDFNTKGGLGKLAGDFTGGMPDVGMNAVAFVPGHRQAWYNRDDTLDYYQELGNPICSVPAYFEDERFVVGAWDVSRGSQPIYLLANNKAFPSLYVEDRKARLRLEVVFAQAVPQVLKHLNYRPTHFWLNESHMGFLYPYVATDPYFSGFKTLFTNHSPEESVMEKFYGQRYESLGLPEEFRDYFFHDGFIDLTRAALMFSDAVNCVSKEAADVFKRKFGDKFPPFAHKLHAITNGTDVRFWRNPHLKHFVGENGASPNPYIMNAHWIMHEQLARLTDLDPQKPIAAFVRRFQSYKNLFPMLAPILPAVCADRGTMVQCGIGEVRGLGVQVFGAGRAPETDGTCCQWIQDFIGMSKRDLFGRFVFQPDYKIDLLMAGVQGADLWIVTPQPEHEACGTSDRDAAHNGVPSVSSFTGGMAEWIKQFNPLTREGNGFIIEPYNSRTLYEQFSTFSDMWYAWKEHGDGTYPQLCANVLAMSHELDIRPCLEKYLDLFRNM